MVLVGSRAQSTRSEERPFPVGRGCALSGRTLKIYSLSSFGVCHTAWSAVVACCPFCSGTWL